MGVETQLWKAAIAYRKGVCRGEDRCGAGAGSRPALAVKLMR